MAGGSILRLIDVVFILLFGFISISEISERSKIKLPESAETPLSNPDREKVIFLGIDSEGTYLVENETKVISNTQDLFFYIQGKAAEMRRSGDELRVRIRSNWDTPIKFTMAAADICDNLQVPKGIDVRKIGG